MRDVKRIRRILGRLEEIWSKYSDLRFGQLLIDMGLVADSFVVWEREDDDLEKFLKRFKKF